MDKRCGDQFERAAFESGTTKPKTDREVRQVTHRDYDSYLALFNLPEDRLARAQTVVDIGAGFSSFSEEARKKFPGLRAIAIDPIYESIKNNPRLTQEDLREQEKINLDFDPAYRGDSKTVDLGEHQKEGAEIFNHFIQVQATHPDDYIAASHQDLPLESQSVDLVLASNSILRNENKSLIINVFTTYDPKLPGNLSYKAKNSVKNIGLNIYDNTKQYGSSGKLIGITIQGNILLDFEKMTSLGVLSDIGKSLFGIGNMLHEVGHFWCCNVGGNFIGNGDPSILEIHNDSSHLYEGLESPAKTQDVLGTVPWLYNKNNNTYYEDNTGDYPLRYHLITLYLMGLLPKDQYGVKFNIFNVGKNGKSGIEIYKKVSVNDIIKFAGERTVENNLFTPQTSTITIQNSGCLHGEIYNATTGQACNITITSTSTTTITPIRRTLRFWTRGDDVKALQSFLGITSDGSFGPMTMQKVIEWQAQNGLTPDGVFGTQSRAKAGWEE